MASPNIGNISDSLVVHVREPPDKQWAEKFVERKNACRITDEITKEEVVVFA
jgi:hypothetical protein